ncbi:MAG: ABC transporter permease subunit [Rhodobacteraceae bacterium]|nr:ABC transporter permease subunit [Paracoccaceae bacterium]
MRFRTILDHLILLAGVIFICGPLISLFFATTHLPADLPETRLTLVPGTAGLANYSRLLGAKFGFTDNITALGMIWNSFLLGAGFAGLKVLVSLLAAYGLIYFRIRFAQLIFWFLLLSLMLPLESRFLATYDVVANLNMVNTHAGLILPLVASGLGTLFFRQFLFGVPDALQEAARMDGAGPIKFFVDILLPISLPTAGALFLVLFITGWNQYLWPVMVTTDEGSYTIVRGLQFFGRANMNGMMLACLAVLPPALLVIFCQRQFVKGLFDGNH